KFTKKNKKTIDYYKVSTIWPGLKGVIPFVKDNSRWIIGNGSTIDFWRDCWGSNNSLKNLVEVDQEI
ncbi:hypothetical protein GIB67_026699, partial [Kingdonia uniflora]